MKSTEKRLIIQYGDLRWEKKYELSDNVRNKLNKFGISIVDHKKLSIFYKGREEIARYLYRQ